MSEITMMLMAEHRQVALDSQHPEHAMAYDLALAQRHGRRPRWWQRRSRPWPAARREAALGRGC